ncbi:hypothetical protein GCM10010428_14540 [Actinosynnema pretiosum subsp. pretiosum]
MAVNLDWRSPALDCNPCMEESFMEKPELPVGPPPDEPGDGVEPPPPEGFGFELPGFGLELPGSAPPPNFAMNDCLRC